MKYVIIGGSAASISAVEAIRSVDPDSQIDLFSDEKTPLFSRVLLPYYVAEELSKPMLNFRSADFFEQSAVTPHIGVRILEIQPASNSVKADDGKSYPYDRLLLATGGNAIVPKIPGVEKEGISTLKTMADAEKVLNMKGKKAVVIGAGSIGVESSISLMRRGMKVTLLEQLGQVLPTVFDEEAASIIRKVIEDMGVEVITGERALEFKGNGRVTGVATRAATIDCDMVLLAVGVRPSISLARDAGIAIGDMGGIKTDAQMRTNIENIYAAGDVCETFDIARNTHFINAIWPMAVEEGKVAGLNMAGRRSVFPGSVRMNSIGNFIGFPAMSMGVTHPSECSYADENCYFEEIKNRTKNVYKKIILKNGTIIGAIFVGQTQKSGIITTLMRKQVDVSEFIPALMSKSLSFMDILPVLRRNAILFSEPEYKEIMDTGL
ncbi:MAG: NAD(P)/FAD-dependent oxidoreductase [Desulfobacteraceae bacterium]|nr:MAG: NAD(P)/FAD-dependent oxidoreductase [Desulfobacteraceae bacterium]